MFNARTSVRVALATATAVLAVTTLAACAQEETPQSTASAGADPCENITTVTDGKLTVGTSDPAFPPYVLHNDPSNGKGFESAVAYAVADKMGFPSDQVQWTFAGFNKLFAPGQKDFDFALNQISITPNRERAVTFSDPYYEAANAVLVLDSSQFASATSLADLQDAKIGVQVNTTGEEQVKAQIAPTQDLSVFDDSVAATQALKNGQIDAFVTDLPTALYLATVEVDGGKVIGQLPKAEAAETWGLAMQKDNPLVSCVNQALGELKDSGELDQITTQWMTDYSDAPVLS